MKRNKKSVESFVNEVRKANEAEGPMSKFFCEAMA